MAVSFGAFWLNLQLYFPTGLGWVRRRALLWHLLLYLPQVVMISIILFTKGNDSGLSILVITLQVTLGFIVLIVRRGREKEPLARRQLSLVTWGSGIGLGLLFFMIVLGSLRGILPSLPGWLQSFLILATFLGLLLSPISFAFAFGRYRLLEVEGKLHRGTRYLLTTGLLLVLFFGLLYFISGFLIRGLNITSRESTLALSLVLALGFMPLHRRTQRLFEKRIYPERIRLRAALTEFYASTASLTEREALFARLESSLRQGLGISALVPAMPDDAKDSLLLPGGEELPFGADGDLMRTLRERRKPLLVDELSASDRIPLSPAEGEWLSARHVAIILPMSLRDGLSGLLFLVCDENWVGIGVAGLEELGILGTRVALECENLRLLEASIDQQRMREQLDMARRVQEGFLPSSLPETPGLDLAATFRSCLDVAGDYYDVVALPGGRTLIAVGDVSGKGAGAAMIMANLQASIRSMTRVKVPLGEMVEGINDIIHANTPVGQFITFFAAVYESGTRRLSFVNAGHNPPRVIHAGGGRTELGPVGPILGVFPGLEYPEQSVVLSEGDILVAFTDGVSEAMNSDDDDFGEERIVETITSNGTETPERLLDRIEEAVDAWRGEVELGDDYTLLIGRVI